MTTNIIGIMDEYQSVKKVKAAKITMVDGLTIEAVNLDGGDVVMVASHDWMDKHQPEVGGYIVAYKDGYVSYSPANAFEEGNVLLTKPCS